MTDIDPSLLEALTSLIEGAGGSAGSDQEKDEEVPNLEDVAPDLLVRLRKIEEQINQ